MLIVMTLGYGAPEIVSPDFSGFRNQEIRQRNVDKFKEYSDNGSNPAGREVLQCLGGPKLTSDRGPVDG